MFYFYMIQNMLKDINDITKKDGAMDELFKIKEEGLS